MDENKFWQTITPDSLLIWDQTFPPSLIAALCQKSLQLQRLRGKFEQRCSLNLSNRLRLRSIADFFSDFFRFVTNFYLEASDERGTFVTTQTLWDLGVLAVRILLQKHTEETLWHFHLCVEWTDEMLKARSHWQIITGCSTNGSVDKSAGQRINKNFRRLKVSHIFGSILILPADRIFSLLHTIY